MVFMVKVAVMAAEEINQRYGYSIWGEEWGGIKNGLGKRGSGQTTETRIFN